VLSTFFQVLSEELLRLSVLVLLGIALEHRREGGEGIKLWTEAWVDSRDPAFTHVWWIAGSGGCGGWPRARVRPALAVQGRAPTVFQSQFT
jgi:hypothetical protein